MDHGRRKSILKMQAQEVQPGLAEDDTSFMYRLMVSVDGQVDPGKSRVVPRAPDDVRHLQYAPVLQQGPPVLFSHHFCHALDTGRGQILIFHTDQRPTFGNNLWTNLTPRRSADCQDAVEQEAQHQVNPKQSCCRTFNAEGELSNTSTSHVDLMAWSDLFRNLRSGVACPHNHDSTRLQL
jgi:hypothetical protein